MARSKLSVGVYLLLFIVNVEWIVLEIGFEVVIRFTPDFIRFGGKKRAGNYGYKIFKVWYWLGSTKCDRQSSVITYLDMVPWSLQNNFIDIMVIQSLKTL